MKQKITENKNPNEVSTDFVWNTDLNNLYISRWLSTTCEIEQDWKIAWYKYTF